MAPARAATLQLRARHFIIHPISPANDTPPVRGRARLRGWIAATIQEIRNRISPANGLPPVRGRPRPRVWVAATIQPTGSHLGN